MADTIPCGEEIRHPYYGLFFCDLADGHKEQCQSENLELLLFDDEETDFEPIVNRKPVDW